MKAERFFFLLSMRRQVPVAKVAPDTLQRSSTVIGQQAHLPLLLAPSLNETRRHLVEKRCTQCTLFG